MKLKPKDKDINEKTSRTDQNRRKNLKKELEEGTFSGSSTLVFKKPKKKKQKLPVFKRPRKDRP